MLRLSRRLLQADQNSNWPTRASDSGRWLRRRVALWLTLSQSISSAIRFCYVNSISFDDRRGYRLIPGCKGDYAQLCVKWLISHRKANQARDRSPMLRRHATCGGANDLEVRVDETKTGT